MVIAIPFYSLGYRKLFLDPQVPEKLELLGKEIYRRENQIVGRQILILKKSV